MLEWQELGVHSTSKKNSTKKESAVKVVLHPNHILTFSTIRDSTLFNKVDTHTTHTHKTFSPTLYSSWGAQEEG